MTEVTLSSTKSAFAAWRLRRKNRAERIPDRLWCMALSLYPRYKVCEICKHLGLSGGQFKQRLASFGSVGTSGGFVLASRTNKLQNPDSNCEVKLTVEGRERVLTLCVSAQELGELLPHIGLLL